MFGKQKFGWFFFSIANFKRMQNTLVIQNMGSEFVISS